MIGCIEIVRPGGKFAGICAAERDHGAAMYAKVFALLRIEVARPAPTRQGGHGLRSTDSIVVAAFCHCDEIGSVSPVGASRQEILTCVRQEILTITPVLENGNVDPRA